MQGRRDVAKGNLAADTCARHIEVDAEHNGNLFFWHYENRHIADRQRTVLWLNGGPGCSSMDGAMMEIGPYRVRGGGQLEYNNGSWDEFANLLFVDQPVGTGFSYVNTDSYLTGLEQMADHMMLFLEKWFALFPEYEHDDVSTMRRSSIHTLIVAAVHRR
jgi:carboxypeptidase D